LMGSRSQKARATGARTDLSHAFQRTLSAQPVALR
jgi:hypothetical protein